MTDNRKHVLCLDGGGGAGRWSLSILNFIATAAETPLTEIFDLIGSVSIGAWLGALVAFGFLDDAKKRNDIYQNLLTDLGDTFRERNISGPLLAPKYSGAGKRDTIRRIFGEKLRLGNAKIPLAILCSTMGGKPRIFESWNPSDKDIFLIDILDATSAIPAYFPPVLIRQTNEILIDGGILSNKPLELSYLKAKEFFGKMQDFNLLSIGTRTISELQQKPMPPLNQLGLIAWLGLGLFDIAIGVGNDIPVKLMNELLGDKFLRVACDCAQVESDSLTVQSENIMTNSVLLTWETHGTKILNFLKNQN